MNQSWLTRRSILLSHSFLIAPLMLFSGISRAQTPEKTACVKHISSEWTAAAQAAAQTDCQFYSDNLADGPGSWAKYADEHVATSFANGRQALREAVTSMYARPNFKLEWYPESAVERGSFVVTAGRSVRSWRLPDQSLKVVHGHYLTVWLRQEDGKYLFVYDVGEDDPK